MKELPKIKKNTRGELYVELPSGEKLPETELKIVSTVGSLVTCIVEFQCTTDFIENKLDMSKKCDPDNELQKINNNLKIARESALFWEKQYEIEKNKKWYQKLFRL